MAEDGQRALRPHADFGEDAVEVVDSGYRMVVEGYDYVAFPDSGAVGGTFFFAGDHDDSGFFGQVIKADDAAVDGDGLGGDADKAAANASIAKEAAGHEFGGVDADGEADALRGKNGGGVDAHNTSGRIDQRAAGVAGVKGGVGLNDVIDEAAGVTAQRAAESADHSGGHGGLKAVRIADRYDELADAELLRIAERGGDEAGFGGADFVDADDGEVAGGVVADGAGREAASVGEGDLDAAGVVNDVAVGEDEAVGGKDKAGASTFALLLGTGASAGWLRGFLDDFDVDDRGSQAVYGTRDGAGVGVEQGSIRGSKQRWFCGMRQIRKNIGNIFYLHDENRCRSM